MTSAGRKRHEVLPPGISAGEEDRSSVLQILDRARRREMVRRGVLALDIACAQA